MRLDAPKDRRVPALVLPRLTAEGVAPKCWNDGDYVPDQAGQRLMSQDGVRNATLEQIKTMMAFCARGERFCDGH